MKKKLGDYTVVLVKPDGVERGIIGELVTRFEKVGLKIAAAKLIWVDKTHVGKHYKDDKNYHKSVGLRTLENYKKYGIDSKENLGTKDPVKVGEMVRKWNMEFLSSGPVFAFLLTGMGAVEIVRKMIGPTYPADAPPGTLRGDYSLESAYNANVSKRTIRNLVHASGTKEEAVFERKLWFKEEEIYSY
ncbi:nucleoside-diphosphate kinase [Patescibacteria group bacterium]|nr:nucleoside-diphosphate kinase [Patescibacteria group bacterium]MBU0777239.1 nucleoside-diphosphate kinase [Patescibacteria group bacterium]MBU0845934.1 nucleoside-diphosphate kinase [Patescibacteria group bacterium]MBU0922962.1 nucleoside-diphosphate kinase [Patescibacteria group bacterium]MBU1066188.1 nucleoside-diphosphate kinase [Patescibacteria group bacterium]